MVKENENLSQNNKLPSFSDYGQENKGNKQLLWDQVGIGGERGVSARK